MFANDSNLKGFVHYLNINYHNIKFISEFEENNSFAFLDIKVMCIYNKLFTYKVSQIQIGLLKASVRYFLFFSPNDSPSKTMKNVFCFI